MSLRWLHVAGASAVAVLALAGCTLSTTTAPPPNPPVVVQTPPAAVAPGTVVVKPNAY